MFLTQILTYRTFKYQRFTFSICWFLPGEQYYTYEFLHQPSHEECITMSESSPSTLFRRYTDIYYNNYERSLSELFSDCELCCERSSVPVLGCCHLIYLNTFLLFSAPAS